MSGWVRPRPVRGRTRGGWLARAPRGSGGVAAAAAVLSLLAGAAGCPGEREPAGDPAPAAADVVASPAPGPPQEPSGEAPDATSSPRGDDLLGGGGAARAPAQPPRGDAGGDPGGDAAGDGNGDGDGDGDGAATQPGLEESIPRGAVLRVGRDLAVAVMDVASRPPAPAARLSVGAGQLSFHALVSAGGRVRVGDGVLEVTAVGDLGAGGEGVRVRWIAEITPPGSASQALVAAPGGDRVRLEEMGFYSLADGRIVAVGNVTTSQALGQAPAPAFASLVVYPASYPQRPTQDFDLHLDVRGGQELAGRVARLVAHQVTPGERGARGWVEVSVAGAATRRPR